MSLDKALCAWCNPPKTKSAIGYICLQCDELRWLRLPTHAAEARYILACHSCGLVFDNNGFSSQSMCEQCRAEDR